MMTLFVYFRRSITFAQMYRTDIIGMEARYTASAASSSLTQYYEFSSYL